MNRVLAEGHRGYCARYPENTLASYRAALEAGVDAMEFDVWQSKDGVPVIMHDGNAYRICGVDKKLGDMTLEEIKRLDAGAKFSPAFAGERVPTLREVLALAREIRPDVILGVEIKLYTEDTCDKTVALLKEYGFFRQMHILCVQRAHHTLSQDRSSRPHDGLSRFPDGRI